MNANPQVVAFCNNRIRKWSDLTLSDYMSAKKMLVEWGAQGLGSLIPNDATVIADGAANDGRPPVTNAQVLGMIGLAAAIVNFWETNQLAAGAVATNANIIMAAGVAVNASSAF